MLILTPSKLQNYAWGVSLGLPDWGGEKLIVELAKQYFFASTLAYSLKCIYTCLLWQAGYHPPCHVPYKPFLPLNAF